jgi:hypothetical protein
MYRLILDRNFKTLDRRHLFTEALGQHETATDKQSRTASFVPSQNSVSGDPSSPADLLQLLRSTGSTTVPALSPPADFKTFFQKWKGDDQPLIW